MKALSITWLFILMAVLPSWGVDLDGQQVIVSARRQANIFSSDSSPFQMEVDFVAQNSVSVDGHLTLKWASKDRWWRKATMGIFQEIDIRNGEKLSIVRNVGFTPLRVKELQTLIGVAEDSRKIQVKKQKQRTDAGLQLTCLQIQYGEDSGRKHDLCFNPTSRDLLTDNWSEPPDEIHKLAYSGYAEFRGHRYPRKMELFINGSRVVSANVVSLENASLDAALMDPPKGAIERRQCPDMKHAVPIKQPDPQYPQSASQNRIMGDTTVAMTVLADGSVGDVQLIASGGKSLDNATLQTLKSWKFKPAMCGTEPVITDIEVEVNFRLEP
jgi:TonB family protein